MAVNPCVRCGACCAFFRASFYYGECDDVTPDGVPVALTGDIGPFRRAMRGTSQPEPRCTALSGTIGEAVQCTIYASRSSTCRGFAASYEDGTRSLDCDRARLAHGLPPLTPEDWAEDEGPENAPPNRDDHVHPAA
jgi:Fe-S-cluster containining protein